ACSTSLPPPSSTRPKAHSSRAPQCTNAAGPPWETTRAPPSSTATTSAGTRRTSSSPTPPRSPPRRTRTPASPSWRCPRALHTSLRMRWLGGTCDATLHFILRCAQDDSVGEDVAASRPVSHDTRGVQPSVRLALAFAYVSGLQ